MVYAIFFWWGAIRERYSVQKWPKTPLMTPISEYLSADALAIINIGSS